MRDEKHSHNDVLSLVGRSGRSFGVNTGTEKWFFESSAMYHKFVMTVTKDVDVEERKKIQQVLTSYYADLLLHHSSYSASLFPFHLVWKSIIYRNCKMAFNFCRNKLTFKKYVVLVKEKWAGKVVYLLLCCPSNSSNNSPGDSWNALLTISFSNWLRSQWGKMLCYTLFWSKRTG